MIESTKKTLKACVPYAVVGGAAIFVNTLDGGSKLLLNLLPFALLAFFVFWSIGKVNWKVVWNRFLYCIASIGLFCFLNQIGLIQVTTDYVSTLDYRVKEQGKK